MNKKNYIIASIAVFVANQVTDPIIHIFLLSKSYQVLSHIWRPDMESKMWIMTMGSLVFAFLFVLIFTKGYEGKGLLEGIRFGLLLGVLMSGVTILQQYVVYPVPFSLAVQWCVYGIVQYLIYGTIAAFLYKPKSSS